MTYASEKSQSMNTDSQPSSSLPEPISEHVEILWSSVPGESHVLIDGHDITNWIAAEPILIEHRIDGVPLITLTLTARSLSQRMLPTQ